MHNDGFTLISMLFDKQLNWPFVVGNTIAGSQIIAYVPALISAAIDDPSTFSPHHYQLILNPPP